MIKENLERLCGIYETTHFCTLRSSKQRVPEKAVLWAKYQGSDLSKLIRESLTIELKKAGMIKSEIPVVEQTSTEEKEVAGK